MSFWGVEVKPGKPFSLPSEGVPGRIHVSQATLGSGSSSKKSTVQCNVGNKSPIFLCTLLPEKIESCPLYLEFGDDDEVIFSVIGPRSVHLSGVCTSNEQIREEDDDSYGEDIGETESEESTDYDSEDDYEEDFIDDGDIQMFPSSPIRNSGVVIEEILDDVKASKGNSMPKQLDQDDSQSQRQMVVKSDNAAQVFESEDEDGFPISPQHKSSPLIQKDEAKVEKMADKEAAEEAGENKKMKKKKAKDEVDSVKSSKRKKDTLNQGSKSERKKNKTMKEQSNDAKASEHANEDKINVLKEDEIRGLNGDAYQAVVESQSEEKKTKKKKKKAKTQVLEGDKIKEKTDASTKDTQQSSMDAKKETELHPSQARTFGNGLVVEELAMGRPDGKKASIGKKVSVYYIGKLKKSGQIFDSNIGAAPFKFRLGVNRVIKGWDVGVAGMRVGDKRRLTIPPSMAYGGKRVGSIPANSWLVFDVELVDVQ